MSLLIYTDGSCIGNPWPWGWAVIISQQWEEVVLTGRSTMTTNNVMELTAAIKALQWLWEDCTKKQWLWNDSDVQDWFFASPQVREMVDISHDVTIVTDSNYVKLGITERMVTRKRRQRRRAKGGKLVENVDLRKELDALASCFPNLNRQRTKAHVGTEMNERVDQLARNEAGR
jgi:ribonuclease HI